MGNRTIPYHRSADAVDPPAGVATRFGVELALTRASPVIGLPRWAWLVQSTAATAST